MKPDGGCQCRARFGIYHLIVSTPFRVTGQRLRAPLVKRAVLPLSLILFTVSGCSLFQGRGVNFGSTIPLTVQLRFDQSVLSAALNYRDACGQPKVLPIQQPLQEVLARRLDRVFQRLYTPQAPAKGGAPDGYVDVGLGFGQADLFVPRRSKRSYPATVNLGVDYAYTDLNGQELYRKKLQSSVRGDIEADDSSCDLTGLEKIVKSAIDKLADGMVIQLASSTKILDAAAAKSSGPSPVAAGTPVASPAVSQSGAPDVPAGPAAAFPPESPAPPPVVGEGGPTKLSFRAILRDDNRNQVLELQESLVVEVEVKNDGVALAQAVDVHVGGTAGMFEQVPAVVPVGDLEPGGIKRVTFSGKMAKVQAVEQVELVLSLQTASLSVQLPPAKKFLIAVRPEKAEEVEVLSVDVDQMPKKPSLLKQPKAVGIAIGIGSFRDGAMPQVKFASRDAEKMAGYMKAVMGIPEGRVRLLRDNQALKGDLAEVFEEWLPQHADRAAPAVVYIAGRAVVDQGTGAVSLVPFDGSTVSLGRLFSIRRLQGALVRAGVQRAILILELSLEPTPGADPSRVSVPAWDITDADSGKEGIMWIIGNRSAQESHAYEMGQHGLFTYYVFKGLRGAADADKNGTVVAGELCQYVKGQVQNMAKTQFGNEQEPLCMPPTGKASPVRLIPLAKTK